MLCAVITLLQRLISYSRVVLATTDLPYDPIGLGVGLTLVIIALISTVVAVVLAVYFYRYIKVGRSETQSSYTNF